MGSPGQTPNAAIPASLRSGPSNLALLLPIPVMLFVHGYHPFANDGGLYVAGIRHSLDPSLYPVNAAFAAAFTHYSVFAWTLAWLARLTHLPLAEILLTAHLASLWLFLCACRALAARLFAEGLARWCGVLLAAACCTLPVAGTALVLMDPYVTARSFSTPLGLFAVAACLDRAWGRTALLLLGAGLLHPLMGAFAAGFVVILALIRGGRTTSAIVLCCAAGISAAIAWEAMRNAPVSPAYREAVLLPQRTFLFLARWRWYELLGLVLPLVLFGSAVHKYAAPTPIGALCRTCICMGTTGFLIAAVFVHPAGPYVLVPFQILRSFHMIYLVGVVLLGGALASIGLRNRAAMAPTMAALLVLPAAILFKAEGVTWAGCSRIECPGRPPANPYEQAFLWIRNSTPRDAVFAFNPELAYLPGEDEQAFRAIAERDQLADDKDAGVAAVLPALAGRWALQRNSELFVDSMTDAQRFVALSPLGATWLLLSPGSQTSLPCPYSNGAVQVCRLVRPPAPVPHPKGNGPGLVA